VDTVINYFGSTAVAANRRRAYLSTAYIDPGGRGSNSSGGGSGGRTFIGHPSKLTRAVGYSGRRVFSSRPCPRHDSPMFRYCSTMETHHLSSLPMGGTLIVVTFDHNLSSDIPRILTYLYSILFHNNDTPIILKLRYLTITIIRVF